MFRFPKDQRSEIWAINCGNPSLLTLGVDKLHSRYLCQEHFSFNDFMQGSKKSLKPTAVPYRCDEKTEEKPSMSTSDDQLQLLTPTKTHTSPRAADTVEVVFPSPTVISTSQKKKILNLIQTPSPNLKRKLDNNSPNKIKLKQQIAKKSKLMHNKNTHILKLKRSVSKYKNHINFNNLMSVLKFLSCNSRAMVTMQLKSKCRSWTNEEKNVSLNLFYKSPSMYNFLRSKKINLPSPSTIKRWIGQSKFIQVKRA